MTTPDPSPLPVAIDTTLGSILSAISASDDRLITGAAAASWALGVPLLSKSATAVAPPATAEPSMRATAATPAATHLPPRLTGRRAGAGCAHTGGSLPGPGQAGGSLPGHGGGGAAGPPGG